MIKNFIYLDEEKMYSLSSQLFEGVTEYVLNVKSSEKNETEEQKGPVGSGRILGDILRNSERNTEKKFLNDYSYTIFEKKLLDDEKVLLVSSIDPYIEDDVSEKSFIKITAKAALHDISSMNATIKNFNPIGQALTHLTNIKEIDEVKEEFEKAGKNTKDRNEKSKLQVKLKAITNIEKLAKKSGLQQDQKFLDDLSFLLNYGFQDQFEVQMESEGTMFSANLNRCFLREPEDLVIRKYSRKTEVEFTLFGIVTQYKNQIDVAEEEEEKVGSTMKEAIMTLFSHLSKVESTFTGRLPNEVIIDPIALYTKI